MMESIARWIARSSKLHQGEAMEIEQQQQSAAPATPEQRTEAIRKAMATIIAEKVEATNREILTRRDDPETRIDDFAELMRDAGRNVGLLTAALGRVMVYDELLAMLREFGEGGPRTSHLIESYQRLMSQAKREAS